MKVVHVLKRIETIDSDIKELRKLEKTVKGNKSFTTPIVMSIEKQINIILGERIKLLELRIDNPPVDLTNDHNDEKSVAAEKTSSESNEKTHSEKKASSRVKITGKIEKSDKKVKKAEPDIDDDDFEIPMLTQDQIDHKISNMKKNDVVAEKTEKKPEKKIQENETSGNSDSIKLLDIALEKGTIDKSDASKPKDRKIRFFRDNFPAE